MKMTFEYEKEMKTTEKINSGLFFFFYPLIRKKFYGEN